MVDRPDPVVPRGVGGGSAKRQVSARTLLLWIGGAAVLAAAAFAVLRFVGFGGADSQPAPSTATLPPDPEPSPTTTTTTTTTTVPAIAGPDGQEQVGDDESALPGDDAEEALSDAHPADESASSDAPPPPPADAHFARIVDAGNFTGRLMLQCVDYTAQMTWHVLAPYEPDEDEEQDDRVADPNSPRDAQEAELRVTVTALRYEPPSTESIDDPEAAAEPDGDAQSNEAPDETADVPAEDDTAETAAEDETDETTAGDETAEVTAPDEPPVPVASVVGSGMVVEGGSASYTVSVSPMPESPLTVTVVVSAEGDYGVEAAPQTVTVPVTGSVLLALGTIDDLDDEPDGSVTATIDEGSDYVVSPTHATATVAVADDDALLFEVSSISGRGIDRGGTGQVNGVVRQRCPEQSAEHFALWAITVEGHDDVAWEFRMRPQADDEPLDDGAGGNQAADEGDVLGGVGAELLEQIFGDAGPGSDAGAGSIDE